MMLKSIEYEKLKPAIKVAFEHDKDIFKYYDPNVPITSVNEIVEDIYRKIGEYEGQLKIYEVYERFNLAGYIVAREDRLISFGLAVEYRFRKHLNNFFSLIKGLLGKNFYCLLWTRNIRAAKWLIKNGMTETFYDNNIIKLSCL